MKDIYELFSEAYAIVEECCGDVIGEITDLSINNRSKKRWGMCHHDYKTDTFQLQISKRILADEVPYNATLSVMVHEILHSCDGGQSHTGKWKVYAKQVMDKHPDLTITRTTPAEFFRLEPREMPKRKYAIRCTKCGKVISRARMCTVIKYPELCTHKYCGGSFERVK